MAKKKKQPPRNVDSRQQGARQNNTWRCATTFLLIAASVGIIYARGLSAPFIFDDDLAIRSNSSIRSLWPLWGPAGASSLRPIPELSTSGRPLVNFSFALNYYFGGLTLWGYHLTNLMVHILSAMLLYGIVRRTLTLPYFSGRFDKSVYLLATAAALLWAVHPLNTDAVEYIIQRTELFVGFFYLATLYSSLRYFAAETPASRRNWLVAATVACCAGMASKEVMVTAPVVVLLYERTFFARSFLEVLRRSWPLYSALFGSWVILFLLNIGGPRAETAGFHLSVPLYAYWATEAKILLLYLKLTVWPHPLQIHYDVPYLQTAAEALPVVLLVAALVIATAYLTIKNKPAGFMLAVVFLVLSPTLIVPIITENAAERRMYLPLAVLCSFAVVALYAGLQKLAARRQASPERESPSVAKVFSATILLFILASIAVGVPRVAAFNDPIEMFRDAGTHQPHNFRIQDYWGTLLNTAGYPQEAIPHFEAAMRINPSFVYPHHNMAVALTTLGRKAEAMHEYEEAVRLKPDFAEAHSNLGALLIEAGRRDEAIAHYEAALHAKPNFPEAHSNLAVALVERGEAEQAILHCQEALRIKPDYSAAESNWGLALTKLNRYAEALPHFQRAVALEPTSKNYISLALCNAEAGHETDAIRAAETAIQLARAERQLETAAQIEAWLAERRAAKQP